MTRRSLSIIAVLLLTAAAVAADQPETLESLKARAEQTTGGKQVELLTEVAKRQLASASRAFAEEKPEQAQAAVQDVGAYAVRAGTLSTSSGKKMKDTEIALRKLSNELQQLERTLEFEQQAPVKDVVQKIEHTRTALLARMFGK